MTGRDWVVLRLLERLVCEEERLDREACAWAGVDPLLYTRCPACVRRGGIDLDCTYCGGSGVIGMPF